MIIITRRLRPPGQHGGCVTLMAAFGGLVVFIWLVQQFLTLFH